MKKLVEVGVPISQQEETGNFYLNLTQMIDYFELNSTIPHPNFLNVYIAQIPGYDEVLIRINTTIPQTQDHFEDGV